MPVDRREAVAQRQLGLKSGVLNGESLRCGHSGRIPADSLNKRIGSLVNGDPHVKTIIDRESYNQHSAPRFHLTAFWYVHRLVPALAKFARRRFCHGDLARDQPVRRASALKPRMAWQRTAGRGRHAAFGASADGTW